MILLLIGALVVSLFVASVVHELAHLLAGKLLGCTILRMKIGVGPTAIGFRLGNTEYCFGLFPFIGGYVLTPGEEWEKVLELEGDLEYFRRRYPDLMKLAEDRSGWPEEKLPIVDACIYAAGPLANLATLFLITYLIPGPPAWSEARYEPIVRVCRAGFGTVSEKEAARIRERTDPKEIFALSLLAMSGIFFLGNIIPANLENARSDGMGVLISVLFCLIMLLTWSKKRPPPEPIEKALVMGLWVGLGLCMGFLLGVILLL
jgi:membrane-associated protease RseP (regulator of RpoE activity)